jgi:hypothetical protein
MHPQRFVALAASLMFVTVAIANPGRADEPLFGFTYTTDLLPQGRQEVEQWLTWRHQKARGRFDVWEGRTEYSYGVTDDFQGSIYLNYNKTIARQNALDGTTAPPESFAGNRVDPNATFNASKFIGISFEGIYRLMSPYTDPFGLALYIEPTIGSGLRELETKIVFQKNFLDDRLVLAANITVAQELRWLPADPDADPDSAAGSRHWDQETDLNFNIGASYRFAPNWSAGLEAFNEREFSRFVFWNSRFRTNSTYNVGPNIHYGGQQFFFTLAVTEQLPVASDYANQNVRYGGRTYADDFEKFRSRLKVGFYF